MVNSKGLAYETYWDGYNVWCYLKVIKDMFTKNICDISMMPSEIYFQILVGLLITPQCIWDLKA